ncbi:MAG TPA: hypothetical protein VFW33_02015 [Gemmataceae bacterium]|nr:hypothetical protein [Gemmataceae bacterium]
MNRDEIVRRLKDSQEINDQYDYLEGKLFGRRWAEEKAAAKELRRIADYIGRCDKENIPWYDPDCPGWQGPFGATDNFAIAARPSGKGNRAVVAEFWQDALDDRQDRIKDAAFLQGFGEGVVEVWNEVKDQL